MKTVPFYKVSGYMTPADMLNGKRATRRDKLSYRIRKVFGR